MNRLARVMLIPTEQTVAMSRLVVPRWRRLVVSQLQWLKWPVATSQHINALRKRNESNNHTGSI